MTNTLFRTAALAMALAAAGTAVAASASLRTYDTEAEFLAAVGIVQTETFNRFTTDLSSALGASGNLGDFTVQGAWTVDAPGNVLDVDGSTNLFIDVSYGGWADLHFAQPLKAFGAWFSRVPATISVDADSLSGYGSYAHLGSAQPAGSTLQFIGFTSDEAFNRIVFEGRGCCSGSFAIDNMAYAASLSPSAVPEPATWALLAAGGIGLGWSRRRAL